jgi:phage terminase large subunit-like protein
VIKLKAEWPDVRKLMISTAENEHEVELGIESAIHGLAVFQELMREQRLVGITLRSVNVPKDKISRALPVASRAEAGKVKLCTRRMDLRLS